MLRRCPLPWPTSEPANTSEWRSAATTRQATAARPRWAGLTCEPVPHCAAGLCRFSHGLEADRESTPKAKVAAEAAVASAKLLESESVSSSRMEATLGAIEGRIAISPPARTARVAIMRIRRHPGRSHRPAARIETLLPNRAEAGHMRKQSSAPADVHTTTSHQATRPLEHQARPAYLSPAWTTHAAQAPATGNRRCRARPNSLLPHRSEAELAAGKSFFSGDDVLRELDESIARMEAKRAAGRLAGPTPSLIALTPEARGTSGRCMAYYEERDRPEATRAYGTRLMPRGRNHRFAGTACPRHALQQLTERAGHAQDWALGDAQNKRTSSELRHPAKRGPNPCLAPTQINPCYQPLAPLGGSCGTTFASCGVRP